MRLPLGCKSIAEVRAQSLMPKALSHIDLTLAGFIFEDRRKCSLTRPVHTLDAPAQ
jgi:hypothetical protein